jgi:hypothetical protein
LFRQFFLDRSQSFVELVVSKVFAGGTDHEEAQIWPGNFGLEGLKNR